MPGAPRHAAAGIHRPGLVTAGIGLLVLLVCLGGIRLCVGTLGGLEVSARPATAQEAPDPAHVQGTYVGDPGSAHSSLPALRRIMVRLAALALIAAIGAGMIAWGLQVALRRPPVKDGEASEGVPDAPQK